VGDGESLVDGQGLAWRQIQRLQADVVAAWTASGRDQKLVGFQRDAVI